MRSLENARQRWQVTIEYISNDVFLEQTLKGGRNISPCSEGLRSVFWKVFLLFKETDISRWPKVLDETRKAYKTRRKYHLRYIENPDELKEALDPLDDDVNSPWNTLRKDEQIRAEILQDVKRCMPDNQFFQDLEIQKKLLDILFIFSKTNPEIGYRQGMHELLAPIFWVIEQDAISSNSTVMSKNIISEENLMIEVLDQQFKEHDAYTLFSLLMRSAKSFYMMGESVHGLSVSSEHSKLPNSPIQTRIKRIFGTYLTCLDPELAKHLNKVNVLPQIFLLRWIRLIFGREFCFSELLTVWDALLAVDPGLDLVDTVCVAMLLRVRWQLIEADSSSALKILLNYPPLEAPYHSHELISDGIFLRDNMNIKGGSEIILKYSGRLPNFTSETVETVLNKVKHSGAERTTELPPSPSKLLDPQPGNETLIQGAAKGVIDRGQRFGINKVLKEAVEEVKKNMQELQQSRIIPGKANWQFNKLEPPTSPKAHLSAMNFRNQQLANMLEQASTDLRIVSISGEQEVNSYIVAMEIAIAKIDFVKVYLQDSNMLLQEATLQTMPLSRISAKPS
ncbi:putative tbc domain-containing protein [Erysiphe necator]|uniref:Putative tbc domain-containing protein n=1 Tax=Uncinula necator TaxID=52586 RepID=A0A0B1PHK8_UNCNE|nr:putative tbc domain-containing protein [Erysiphe necator]